MPIQKSVKIVVVGDGAVGKTCLLLSYIDEMPKGYIPTVFENYSMNMVIEGESVTVNLWDTAGQEDMDRLRTISYTNCDLFILCFSTVGPASFNNILDKWNPELDHYSPNTPILLVGTKSDLRQDPNTLAYLKSRNQEPLTYAQGVATAKRIRAVSFLECSALRKEGLNEVFDEAVKVALRFKNKGERRMPEQKPKSKGICQML